MLAIGLPFLAEGRLAHPHLHEVRAVGKRIHKFKLIYVELTRRVLQTTFAVVCYLRLLPGLCPGSTSSFLTLNSFSAPWFLLSILNPCQSPVAHKDASRLPELQ